MENALHCDESQFVKMEGHSRSAGSKQNVEKLIFYHSTKCVIMMPAPFPDCRSNLVSVQTIFEFVFPENGKVSRLS
ncbi:hypothetical protein CEXT_169431 [Caerostris extrusa]|uniref:Transposase n=1 Tax=Caerostris extrusa TaxID=172846 RepID=A0AAV4M7P2_CAEEX|nr:hypothetical protein CEXT_169431 [Caerostris extrusa]